MTRSYLPVVLVPGRAYTRRTTGWTVLSDDNLVHRDMWITKKDALRMTPYPGIPVKCERVEVVTMRIKPPPAKRKRVKP